MSVILYEKEKFLWIYKNLLYEDQKIAHLWDYPKDYQSPDGMILYFQKFVLDLQEANFRAYSSQYPREKIVREKLDFLEARCGYDNKCKFLKSLEGLAYNLINNSGKAFTVQGCRKRLSDLIASISHDIISKLPEYQKAETW